MCSPPPRPRPTHRVRTRWAAAEPTGDRRCPEPPCSGAPPALLRLRAPSPPPPTPHPPAALLVTRAPATATAHGECGAHGEPPEQMQCSAPHPRGPERTYCPPVVSGRGGHHRRAQVAHLTSPPYIAHGETRRQCPPTVGLTRRRLDLRPARAGWVGSRSLGPNLANGHCREASTEARQGSKGRRPQNPLQLLKRLSVSERRSTGRWK